MADPDADLEAMDHAALSAAARARRAAIRRHRDSSGHDVCGHHPDLGRLLPDAAGTPEVPDGPQFLRGCIRDRASLDDALRDAPRTGKEFEE